MEATRQELVYAGKQFMKTLFIAVVLSILLYLSHFFSAGLTIAFALIGSLLLLITLTYAIGHLVRFALFSLRKKQD
ncbi:MAG: hypothetical protein JWN30_2561 [Bacilli bacterium]|nr:hypothetical protein [Bacilli bacterium]